METSGPDQGRRGWSSGHAEPIVYTVAGDAGVLVGALVQ